MSRSKPLIEVGVHVLPMPIQQHIQRSVRGRAVLRFVFHVTELVSGCQRKACFRRLRGRETFDLESCYNIYRGSKLDREWCGLFDYNQEPLVAEFSGLTITGSYDFIWDGYLWDLKRPKSIFYKKRDGAGLYYRRQVQAYLSMLHEAGRFRDVVEAKILMSAEDCMVETVPADDEAVWHLMWKRAFALSDGLAAGTAERLEKSECPEWECKPKYCEFTEECKKL